METYTIWLNTFYVHNSRGFNYTQGSLFVLLHALRLIIANLRTEQTTHTETLAQTISLFDTVWRKYCAKHQDNRSCAGTKQEKATQT